MGNRYAQPVATPQAAPSAATGANRYATGASTIAAQPAPSTPTPAQQQLDPAHQQARAWLDAHPDQQEGYGHALARKAAIGGGLGWGDELAAGLRAGVDVMRHGGSFSENYDLEKAMQDELAKDATAKTGWAGTGAEMVGNVAGALAGGELLGATKLGAAATNAMSGAPAIVRSMATGAAGGAVQGAGDAEGGVMDRLHGANEGFLFGTAGGAVGHGIGNVAGKIARGMNPAPRQAPADSAQAIRDQAKALYDQFENSGGRYTRGALQDARLQAMRALDDAGWAKGAHSQVDAILNRMDTMSSGMGPNEIRPKDMQNVRSMASSLAKSSDPQLRNYGYVLANAMDDAIDNFAQHPGFMVGGSVDTDAFHEANRLYRQATKAQLLEGNLETGLDNAGVTYSGGNETNNILRAVNKTYQTLKKHGGKLTPDEQAAFNAVVRPSRGERAIRSVGKMRMGGGAVSNLMNLMGVAATGPAWAAVPIAAEIADRYANAKALRNAEEVSRIIRAGGVSRGQTPAPTAMQNAISQYRDKLPGPFGVLFQSQLAPAPVRGDR